MAKELDEKLRTLQEDHAQLLQLHKELKSRHKELENQGLSEREAIQLRRLKHLHGRVVNIQVCEGCKKSFDSLLEDAKWIRK